MLIQRVKLKTKSLDVCRLTQIQQRALHCNQMMRDDVHVAFHTCKYVCSIMVFTGVFYLFLAW